MPLHIEDDDVAGLVGELAQRIGTSEQEAIRLAAQRMLDTLDDAVPLSARYAALRERYPMPDRSGLVADKAFFDEVSGDL